MSRKIIDEVWYIFPSIQYDNVNCNVPLIMITYLVLYFDIFIIDKPLTSHFYFVSSLISFFHHQKQTKIDDEHLLCNLPIFDNAKIYWCVIFCLIVDAPSILYISLSLFCNSCFFFTILKINNNNYLFSVFATLSKRKIVKSKGK